MSTNIIYLPSILISLCAVPQIISYSLPSLSHYDFILNRLYCKHREMPVISISRLVHLSYSHTNQFLIIRWKSGSKLQYWLRQDGKWWQQSTHAKCYGTTSGLTKFKRKVKDYELFLNYKLYLKRKLWYVYKLIYMYW